MNIIYLFILAMLFAAFHATSIASSIFRQSVEDGSNIILQAKPIGRPILILAKIVIFVILSFLFAALNSLIAIFASFTKYGGYEIANIVAKNFFLATIILYFFIGTLSILLSIYLKHLITIIATIGLFLIMMIYSLIAGSIFLTVPKYLSKNYSIDTEPVSLVLKDNANPNNINYKGGAIARYKLSDYQYVTQNIYCEIVDCDNTTNHGTIKPEEFLKTMYSLTTKENNYYAYIYTNFVYQLATIYTGKGSQFWNLPYLYTAEMIRSSNFFNISLKFQAIDNTTKNSMLKYDVTDSSSNNSVSYWLTNNAQVGFIDTNKVTHVTSAMTLKNEGKINFFDEQTKLPVPKLNGFEVFDYSENSLNNFINTFYNENFIKVVNNLLDKIENNPVIKEILKEIKNVVISPLSIYMTMFNLWNKMGLPKQLPHTSVQKHVFNNSAIQSSKFQYLTYLALSNNNVTMSETQKAFALKTLNFNGKPSNDIVLPTLLPFGESLLENITDSLYLFTPFFSLVEDRYMYTFTFVSTWNMYNQFWLSAAWLFFSAIMLSVAMHLYFRHDFS